MLYQWRHGVRVGQQLQRGHRGLFLDAGPSLGRRRPIHFICRRRHQFQRFRTRSHRQRHFLRQGYYLSLTAHTNTLATVAASSNGVALGLDRGTLVADGTNNGCHFITASYTGDTNFSSRCRNAGPKIHAYASSTTLTPSTASNAVIFTAKVSGGGAGAAGSSDPGLPPSTMALKLPGPTPRWAPTALSPISSPFPLISALPLTPSPRPTTSDTLFRLQQWKCDRLAHPDHQRCHWHEWVVSIVVHELDRRVVHRPQFA